MKKHFNKDLILIYEEDNFNQVKFVRFGNNV